MSPNDKHANGTLANISPPGGDDPRLADAVEQYRAALRAGKHPDPREYCDRYPDLAGPLAKCLDALNFLHAAANCLTSAGKVPGQPTPPPSGLRAGELLGDFRILREVGCGGMAVVYAAEQVSLRRVVALKVVSFAADADARSLQRFQNEARAAGCLHHPNIVPVYAVGCEGGVQFYAMQLIEGQTIAALIRGLHRPTKAYHYRIVAQVGIQAAAALHYAHAQGIIHRDIKPANLLIDHSSPTPEGSPRLWVTDFGLAHLQGDAALTASGDLVGTIRYMSPEQAKGGRAAIDHRTDVYSLGATLYELLTFTPAFGGDDPRALFFRITEEEPSAPRRTDPLIPDDLEVVVLKAMAKEPADRYATAQELADDLQRFLDDRPIQAKRPSRVQKARRWAKRHRPLVFSLAIAAALLIVGLVVGYTYELKNFGAEQEKLGKQARAELYRSLLSDADAMRLAHQPGYRRMVWDKLSRAASLNVDEKDMDVIARSALACLGDPIGLDPVESPSTLRLTPPKLPAGFEDTLRTALAELKPLGWNINPDAITKKAMAQDGQLVAAFSGDKLFLFGKTTEYDARGAYGEQWQPAGTASHRFLFAQESPFGAIYDVASDQEGTRLVAGCEGGFRVLEIARPGRPEVPGGAVHGTVGSGNVHSVAMHPQGWLTAIAGQHIELWSCPHGRPVAVLPAPCPASRVEFSADGQLLLALIDERVVRGWPVGETPEKRRLHGHEGAGVSSVAFSPDGKLLASGSKDRTVKVWDAATGRLLRTLADHTAPIEAVAFSPDGRLLASGDFRGHVHLWDGLSCAMVSCVSDIHGPPGQVWRLQFDRSGQRLAAAGAKGVAVWDLDHQGAGVAVTLCRAVRTPDVIDMALHPSGESLAYSAWSKTEGASRVFRYDLDKNDDPRGLNLPVGNQLRGLNFDESGKLLTFVTTAGKLGRWDWEGNASAAAPELRTNQWAPAPGGRWVATSTSDRTVVICDLGTGARLPALPQEESDVWTLAWSPDRRRLAVGTSDGAVAIWDLEQVRSALAELGIRMPDIVLHSE
jgi:serine/threonine protein kinase/WD40 repeat protein